jgi:pimeloyl-ACP methyl ester carboxylesterase
MGMRLRLHRRRSAEQYGTVEAAEPGLPPTMPAMSRRSPVRPWPALVATLAVALAACSTGSGVATDRAEPLEGSTEPASPDSGTPSTEPPAAEPPLTASPDTESEAPPDSAPSEQLQWSEVTDQVETAVLEVPVDYENPDGPKFELFVARRLADDQDNKIGSLLVNRGGPGFPSVDYAIFADQIYGEPLLERFDIVAWDPRGAGESRPAVDCVDDYDHYFAGTDITPDDAAEKQQIVDLAEEFTDNCVEENADFFEYVGTNNSARDMDSIRRALGEDQVSFFGFSYGSELGATWATLFPETVRAAVFDGASDPAADSIEHGLQQAQGFEGTISTYLAQCSDDPDCAFHNDGDAEGAFDALMLDLDDEPIPSVSGRPDVTRAMALDGVTQAMYEELYWDELSEALAAAQDGDGEGLLALHDSYLQRRSDGTWGNELEAFQTITCMDDAERLSVEEEDALVPQYLEVAPRFHPNTTGTYGCTFYPASIDPRMEITGAGVGPIVVVGTTGDPATPLSSSRAMAETLEDGRFVMVDADRHTGYNVNDCIDDVVHGYLIDLEAPDDETEC